MLVFNYKQVYGIIYAITNMSFTQLNFVSLEVCWVIIHILFSELQLRHVALPGICQHIHVRLFSVLFFSQRKTALAAS